jgi:putative aminopeptidase FrvX
MDEKQALKKQALKMIGDISSANGVSGFEDEVVALLRRYSEGLGETREDKMRDFYIERGENKGGRLKVQLDAHSDEVGFMVQAIRDNGTMDFIALGGWVPATVPAHRVRVRTKTGNYIPGLIASKPPHFMTEAERAAPPSLQQMVIDVGASSRQEAMEGFGVRVGAPVVPDADFEFIEEHNLMIGKAFDCRLGCAALLGTLRELRGEALDVDVVGAFAVQEEVGTRGAIITTGTVKPDIGIVFEGCPADDTFTPPYAIQTALGKGPMLRHIDSRMITNPRFQRFALELGEELGIPTQEAVRSGGATNGERLHLSGIGVPVIVIGLPVRYIHTHYGIASYTDYENAVALACQVLRRLNEAVYKGF